MLQYAVQNMMLAAYVLRRFSAVLLAVVLQVRTTPFLLPEFVFVVSQIITRIHEWTWYSARTAFIAVDIVSAFPL